MLRKLIRQGKGGLTIYIPKKWADHKGLKEGDDITITEGEAGLLITSAKSEKRSTIVAITEKNSHDLQMLMTHAYRRGCDTITIKGGSLPEVKAITAKFLLGFEITQNDAKAITISNISEPSDEKYDTMLRRLFWVIQESHNSIYAQIIHSESSGSLAELREQQDRFVLFCKRILTREQERAPMLQWELLTFLMQIQHGYYYLGEYLQSHPIKASVDLKRSLDNLGDYLRWFIDAYMKKDIEMIHKINDKKTKFQFGDSYSALESSKGPQTIVHSHIREIFRLIQIGSSPLVAMILEGNASIEQ